MGTRHIILGLLDSEAMTGYDIRSLFKGLSWLIDSPSYGSLYPALHALLEAQLVTVNVRPGQGKPPRKLYQITDAGRQVLRQWLQSPESVYLSTKAFARQLILADSLSAQELAAHLVRRRAQLEAYLNMTESSEEPPKPGNEHLGQRLIHDYGIAIARAELAWLDVRLRELEAETAQTSRT